MRASAETVNLVADSVGALHQTELGTALVHAEFFCMSGSMFVCLTMEGSSAQQFQYVGVDFDSTISRQF